MAVDQRYLDSEPLGERAAAAAINDFPRVIDTILQLLPQTRQVFVVNGAGPHAAFWRRELSQEFGRFRGRVGIVWLEALSLPDLVRRCASLPRDRRSTS